MNTTIASLSTPPGKSGVAVVRISGPEALHALARVCPEFTPTPRHASLKTLATPDGQPIDSALVLYFKAPHSFTGEDVVEIHTHGSRAVIQALLSALDVQAAAPGEFTRRALYNGKLDVLEVEALADLIEAETEKQRLQALRQYSGKVSQQIEGLRDAIIHVLALVEAYIDFPEEDIPESVTSQAELETKQLIATIEDLLADNHVAERIRDGFTVVIAGAPNAGKSTLLNALAKREIAIVSPHAGTTRDMLEVALDIGGYPVTLVDTAGLRDSLEPVEAIGVERARSRASAADIVVLLSAPDAPAPPIPVGDYTLIEVANKIDITPAKKGQLGISAHTQTGLDGLITEIKRMLDAMGAGREHALITRTRHRELLQHAHSYLQASLNPLPLELWCEELRLAAREIGKITGRVDVDHVLDVIFSSFCIGK